MSTHLRTTNIGLALAIQPEQPTAGNFVEEAANHYLGLRATMQQKRTQELKFKTAQHNLRTAIFQQDAAEAEQETKQNEVERTELRNKAYSLTFDKISDEWSAGIEDPTRVNDKWLRQQRDVWTNMIESEQYGDIAKTRLTQINSRGQELHNGKMLKNAETFDEALINGKGWKTMDQVPEEETKFYNMKRIQTGDQQRDPDGKVTDHGVRIIRGELKPSYVAENNAKINKFLRGKTSAEDMEQDSEFLGFVERSPEGSKRWNAAIKQVATEERVEAKGIRAEEREADKEALEDDEGAKTVVKFTLGDEDDGDEFTLTGTPSQVKAAKGVLLADEKAKEIASGSAFKGFLQDNSSAMDHFKEIQDNLIDVKSGIDKEEDLSAIGKFFGSRSAIQEAKDSVVKLNKEIVKHNAEVAKKEDEIPLYKLPSQLKDAESAFTRPARKERRETFDPLGSGFDDAGANAAGLERDETGHLGSLGKGGMLLKGIGHDTFNLALEEENRRGSEIVQRGDRFFSTLDNGVQPGDKVVTIENGEVLIDGKKLDGTTKSAVKSEPPARESMDTFIADMSRDIGSTKGRVDR